MEIYQNSVLKLIVRQGTDFDRKQIILTSGELGYTTDTKRLFVGNSVLSGGDVVGNISHPINTTIPNNYPYALAGDTAYASDVRKLYRAKGTNSNDLSGWDQIGGVYVSGDNYIKISDSNTITLATLSANSLSNDLVKFPLYLDAGKLALSSSIPTSIISTKTVTISSGLRSTSSGNDVTNVPINTLNSDLIIQSNQILAMYNGITSTLSYSRNLSSTPVEKLSAGHYRFYYPNLSTSNIYPISNIMGTSPNNCSSRPISLTSTYCDIQVLSSNGPALQDAIISLTISY
jgi:hypothetical protein